MIYIEIPAGFVFEPLSEEAAKKPVHMESRRLLCPGCGAAMVPDRKRSSYLCMNCVSAFPVSDEPFAAVTDFGSGFLHLTTYLPARQTLILDLRDHRVLLQEQGEEEDEVRQTDLTRADAEELRMLFSCDIFRHLEERQTIREAMKKALLPYWEGREFPYESCELNGDRLVRLALYPGMSGEFLDALPFEPGTFRLPDSCRKAGEAVRDPGKACAFLDENGIRGKRLRNLFLRHPQMFLYTEQIRALRAALGNYDYTVQVLSRDTRCVLPAILSCCSATVLAALEELCRTGGNGGRFAGWLTAHPLDTVELLKQYACADGRMRAVIAGKLAKQLERPLYGRLLEDGFAQEMAARRGDPQLTAVIGQYRVVRLLTSADFRETAEELHNCLGQTRSFLDWSVYAVKQGKETVAAIQIEEDDILQVKARDNLRVKEYSPRLAKALEKWAREHALRFIDKLEMHDFLEDGMLW